MSNKKNHDRRAGVSTEKGCYQTVASTEDDFSDDGRSRRVGADDDRLGPTREDSAAYIKAESDNSAITASDTDRDVMEETARFLPALSQHQRAAGNSDDDEDDEAGNEYQGYHHRSGQNAPAASWISRRTFRLAVVAFVTCLVISVGFKVATDNSGLFLMLPGRVNRHDSGSGSRSGGCSCTTTLDVPLHFQTSPQVFAGPTATGQPAFLAQTVTINPSATYVANEPLQTNIAVEGMSADRPSIFKQMGYLSPYSPSPGFGVQEYALPPGAEIIQLQMLSRHGSRYPTVGTNVETLGAKLAQAKGKWKASGPLSFLNDWEYKLGYEILVPKGRQELFDSGILHSYMYSSLYNPNTKIIVRTTTQDRMLKSSENFLAGFFGLEWTNNATIEVLIEAANFNNSLAGYMNCPNARNDRAGSDASTVWVENYLRNATARFRQMFEGIEWTIQDTYAAQTMCPYETAAYGFSRFCDLFTYDEWVAFGYSVDLLFAGNSGFQSSTGRAVGLGYQQEVLARLRNHTLGYSGSQINITLDNNTDTFPLNQSIYLDFSHDTNIISILTAFGFRQFSSLLPPASYPGAHNFTVSHIVPFGARLDIEIIRTPHPVAADRSGYLTGEKAPSGGSGETKYIHFILNQRTLPLGISFPECDASRVDGWCELETFLRVQDSMVKRAKYDEACFGPFTARPYGMIMDGAPL